MSERLLAPSNVCGTSDCARKCLRHSLENHAPVISTAHSRLNAALYRPDHMQIGFLVTTSPIDAGWSTIWNQSTWTHCLNAKWTVRSRGLLPKSDRYFRWLVTAACWLAELLAAQRKPPRFLPVHERWRALVSACWDTPWIDQQSTRLSLPTLPRTPFPLNFGVDDHVSTVMLCFRACGLVLRASWFGICATTGLQSVPAFGNSRAHLMGVRTQTVARNASP
jgi:hypothetical protein